MLLSAYGHHYTGALHIFAVFVSVSVSVSHGVFGALIFMAVGEGVAHSGRRLVSVFQGFSVSIGKASILAGKLGAGLAFYGVQALS